jgi:hypothetical protein
LHIKHRIKPELRYQVKPIIPHSYDQFYWAHRVQQLGVGVSGPTRDHLTVDVLIQALRECLGTQVQMRAHEVASRMRGEGYYTERASPQNDWRTNSVRRSLNGRIGDKKGRTAVRPF